MLAESSQVARRGSTMNRREFVKGAFVTDKNQGKVVMIIQEYHDAAHGYGQNNK